MNFHLKISLFDLGICTFTAAMYCKLNPRVCLAYISTDVSLHHFSTGLESITYVLVSLETSIVIFLILYYDNTRDSPMHDFISTYQYGVASKNIYNEYMAQYASPLYSESITKLGIKKSIFN